MSSTPHNLAQGFHAHMERQPAATALVLNGTEWSYAALGGIAGGLARCLQERGLGPGTRVGVLADRNLEAYAGILGACWAGCSYVPLNTGQPPERLATLLDRARLHALIVDESGEKLRVRANKRPETVIGPDLGPLAVSDPDAPTVATAEDLAYLMFTSGTTGIPKGVMIRQSSIAHFLTVMQDRYALHTGDRVSQFFELTFDLSVFDLFMTWNAGASLHVLPQTARLGPGAFINEQQLTVWFSVPSALVLMDRFRQLQPGVFPSLRLALFCGEPLPADPVPRWLKAAPNARTENLYGPTEATLACLLEPCEPLRVTRERGTVAIGLPYPGMRADIMDGNGGFLDDNQPGELVLCGSQLAAGYWQDDALTASHFPLIQGERWYRTGDHAYRDTEGHFHHLGRLDNQVKIFGHRVELEDIDTHLRKVCDCETALTVAWPMEHGSAQGVVAFVSGCELGIDDVREGMKQRVPDYMVPRRIVFLDTLPLSANGKFDRKALLARLEQDSPR